MVHGKWIVLAIIAGVVGYYIYRHNVAVGGN